MGNIEIFSSVLVRDENPKFLIFWRVILVQSKYLTSRNFNNFSWMLVPFKQHLWKCKWVKILVGTESRFQVTEIPCFALVGRKHFDDFGVLLHFLWGFSCGYNFWHKGVFYSIRGEKKKKGKNISILFALSCISGALEMHQRVLKAGKAGSLLQVAVPTPDPVPFRGLGMLVAITC